VTLLVKNFRNWKDVSLPAIAWKVTICFFLKSTKSIRLCASLPAIAWKVTQLCIKAKMAKSKK